MFVPKSHDQTRKQKMKKNDHVPMKNRMRGRVQQCACIHNKPEKKHHLTYQSQPKSTNPTSNKTLMAPQNSIYIQPMH